ncbi:MAG: hypothetical protein ACRDJ9_35105 [Dehalococcoidia bacterium]
MTNPEHVAQTLPQGAVSLISRTAPPQPEPQLQAGFATEPVARLDPRPAGITSVVWATEYRCNFNCLQFPVGADAAPSATTIAAWADGGRPADRIDARIPSSAA